MARPPFSRALGAKDLWVIHRFEDGSELLWGGWMRDAETGRLSKTPWPFFAPDKRLGPDAPWWRWGGSAAARDRWPV